MAAPAQKDLSSSSSSFTGQEMNSTKVPGISSVAKDDAIDITKNRITQTMTNVSIACKSSVVASESSVEGFFIPVHCHCLDGGQGTTQR